MVSLAAALVIVAGGFVTFQILTKSPPPPPPRAPAPKKVSPPDDSAAIVPTMEKAAATATATLSAIAAAPGQAITKAQDAMAAARTAKEERIEILTGVSTEPPPIPSHSNAPPPAPITPVKSTAQLAPGVTATTLSDVAGEASPAFRSWVSAARISGIFQGNPPRALINGRMVRAGQLVDETSDITFDHIDPDTKMIVFRDRTGATVSRKF